MTVLTPLFGPIGPELLIIIALIIFLFGANKLPEVARATGKSLSEFKKGQVEGKENTKVFPEVEQTSQDTGSSGAQTTSNESGNTNSSSDQETTVENTERDDGESESGEVTESSGESDAIPVTSVNGVGETYKDRLEENDITSVSDLADANSSHIADIADTSLMEATDWTNEAQRMVNGEEVEKETNG